MFRSPGLCIPLSLGAQMCTCVFNNDNCGFGGKNEDFEPKYTKT